MSVNKNKTRKNNKNKIQHHHLLVRAETQICPHAEDKMKVEEFVRKLIHDIDMVPLDDPKIYYMSTPKYNEGLTAITPIKTSHVAFHFWNTPDPSILHTKEGTCLLQFDIYTCGKLTAKQIRHVLHTLTFYKPCHVDITLLNRKWSLSIDKHEKWDLNGGESWSDWISHI
jgi:S-adenosylmethionine/arginine decarboxylase-like enzyme